MRAEPDLPTAPPAPPAAEVPQPDEKVVEFEIVLGRMQVAGVLFVAVVAVVVFSAMSYVAGRALVSKPAPPAVAEAPLAPPAAVVAPTVEATIIKPDFPIAEPAPKPEPAAAPEPPVFANPAPNAAYLQMGAVEKGVAVIMVDGLRKRGFSAFAAPGPTDVIFRVLVGPLNDAEGFRKTKEKIEQIGLNSFVRKYTP